MSLLPENLKYAPEHTWACVENDKLVLVGITDFAQSELGDVMYINLPKLGDRVQQGEQCGSIESVKTASDLFSPVTGTVVSINESLQDAPEQVNDTPYQAWLFSVEADDLSELDNLLDVSGYMDVIDE
jgi:glycine cleavage system H protein